MKLHHCSLTSFYTYVVCLQVPNIKPSAVRTYHADDVFDLLNYDQKLTIDDVVKIRKQSVLEEAEKPEDEPKERTMKVLSYNCGT